MTTRLSLRVPWHRGTTAHTATLYPFALQHQPSPRGIYIGLDLLAGGAEYCWDPFEAYTTGTITNPNCWILGEPGNGKSALVKTLLWRMTGIYGHGPHRRWIAIVDPKGEYTHLAHHLGLPTLRLAPGGTTRLNPLAATTRTPDESEHGDARGLRRAELVATLAATVLDRALTQLEDSALFATIEDHPNRSAPTLNDITAALTDPSPALSTRLRQRPESLTEQLAPLAYALDKLCTRTLRGMFDGHSTVNLDPSGPGLHLDLSAIPVDSDALPLVMAATAGWLTDAICDPTPGPRRLQVLDEAWALLASRHTASYLQACFKLGRTYGVANLCIAHRASDLAAQADDGTATAKIAAGLLADAATKIILRQAPDQADHIVTAAGLPAPARTIITQLTRGRALWRVGSATSVVQHLLAPAEHDLCDTDQRMNQ